MTDEAAPERLLLAPIVYDGEMLRFTTPDGLTTLQCLLAAITVTDGSERQDAVGDFISINPSNDATSDDPTSSTASVVANFISDRFVRLAQASLAATGARFRCPPGFVRTLDPKTYTTLPDTYNSTAYSTVFGLPKTRLKDTSPRDRIIAIGVLRRALGDIDLELDGEIGTS